MGHDNETVRRLGRSANYIDALRDLEAALQWAKVSGGTGAIAAWGSSYSAALVFCWLRGIPTSRRCWRSRRAEYLSGNRSVHSAAARLSIPIFVTSAKDLDEIAATKSILDAAPSADKIQFVPGVGGTHGSSTLRTDRNPKGAQENWDAVKSFLARAGPSSPNAAMTAFGLTVDR